MEKITQLKTYLINAPEDPFLNHALALEYIKTGDEEAAKQLFTGILTRDPLYVGSYYHLAALFERTGDAETAKTWYESGMKAAKKAGDSHAFNELQAAYENLID